MPIILGCGLLSRLCIVEQERDGHDSHERGEVLLTSSRALDCI